MPAVLLEAGSIVNRDEELLLGTPEHQHAHQRGGGRGGGRFLRPAPKPLKAADRRARTRPGRPTAGTHRRSLRRQQARSRRHRQGQASASSAMSLEAAARLRRGWHRRARSCLTHAVQAVRAQSALPAGFVYLRDVDPTIAQDMRYASADNFVGRPLPGYDARRMHAAARRGRGAQAGAGGSRGVRPRAQGLRLLPPARAPCTRWRNGRMTAGRWRRPSASFPRLQKNALFALGYIAARPRIRSAPPST